MIRVHTETKEKNPFSRLENEATLIKRVYIQKLCLFTLFVSGIWKEIAVVVVILPAISSFSAVKSHLNWRHLRFQENTEI